MVEAEASGAASSSSASPGQARGGPAPASLPRQPSSALPSFPSQLRDEAVTQRLNFRAGEHHRHHGHFGLCFPKEGAWLGAAEIP